MRKIICFLLFVFFFSFSAKGQDFISITADTLISYYAHDYEKWHSIMQDYGFKLETGKGGDPVYFKGEIGALGQGISKTDYLVSVHVHNMVNDDLYLAGVFEEIKSKGEYVDEDFNMAFYIYCGYLFGLTYLHDEIFTEGIFIMDPSKTPYHLQ